MKRVTRIAVSGKYSVVAKSKRSAAPGNGHPSRSPAAPRRCWASRTAAQNQSTDPSEATSAAVCRSPIRPWSAIRGSCWCQPWSSLSFDVPEGRTSPASPVREPLTSPSCCDLRRASLTRVGRPPPPAGAAGCVAGRARRPGVRRCAMTDLPEGGVDPARPRVGAVPRSLHVRARPGGRHGPHRPGPATPGDVPAPHRGPACSPRPRPTVVLVSHLHHDHLDVPSLAGRAGSVIVVPQGSQRLFRRHGFPDVVPLSAGESHRVGGLTVTATPARHSGRREPFGPTAEAVGFLLEGGGGAVYFAGDTDLLPQMRGLGAPLDLALLPVWGLGPAAGLGSPAIPRAPWTRLPGSGPASPYRCTGQLRRVRPLPGRDRRRAPARRFAARCVGGGSTPTCGCWLAPAHPHRLSRVPSGVPSPGAVSSQVPPASAETVTGQNPPFSVQEVHR